MKKNLKITIFFLFISILIVGIIQLTKNSGNEVLAANSNSTSDVQLLARAINGEARGEPYEGQVAVRSCYIESCKTCKFSKYYRRCNI